MTNGTSWWSYLRAISGEASGTAISRATGVDPGSVSRWKSGTVQPSAETAITVARAYDRPPVEALIAAGHLSPAEANRLVITDRPVTDFSARELLDEIYRRIPEGEP